MASLKICILGNGSCSVDHEASKSVISTEVPLEYGGKGGAFSSTDLLAAALGTCIASSIEPILKTEGVELKNVEITVNKKLSLSPKEISLLMVSIYFNEQIGAKAYKKILKVSNNCVVHKCLKTNIIIKVVLKTDSSVKTKH